MSSLLDISYSLMGSLIKVNGMKEIPTYPFEIPMLLLNVGEITLITKFLILSQTYGKIIISQETQIESMFLVLNHMFLLLVIQKESVMMIQESFSYQGKALFMSHCYIVDFATSMLLTMNMNVMMISHGILMMVSHMNFMILIRRLACTTAKILQ